MCRDFSRGEEGGVAKRAFCHFLKSFASLDLGLNDKLALSQQLYSTVN